MKAQIRSSLQSRMILYVLFLLTVVMVVTTSVGARRESSAILEQMRKDGIALANAYALSAENAIMLGAGLGRVTGEASRTRGIKYLKIVDDRGKVIGHTDVSQIGRRVEEDRLYREALSTPITAVEKGKRPITLVDKGENGEDIFRVIVPLVKLASVAGALEVGLDMTGIAEAIRRTNNQSLVIALAAFAVGGACIWVFARSLTRPIKDLVEAAERIAGGDLEHEIPVTAADEIGHLASSFNHMTRELREYTGNLKRTAAQLEADAAIIEELQRYTQNILASIRPGVLTFDVSGRITTLNRAGCDILGLGGQDVIGKTIFEVLAEREPLRKPLEETLTERRVVRGEEIRFSWANGGPGRAGGPDPGGAGGAEQRETLLFLNTAFLYDQNSEVVGVAATFEDVTEMRTLQRRIYESEKLAAMGELAVGVAHEVRNPLGALKTCAQFLEDRLAPEDPKHKMTRLIIREAERLDQLVRRLLDFTRPAEKDFQYEDLNELVEKAATLAALKATDRRLVVDRQYAIDIPPVLADATRLQQAFLNVMLNAIDAMPNGGTLTIRTCAGAGADGHSVMVEFRDTGEGIPPERLNRIFSPFFTTRQQGTGLGLAIVHRIVSEHNGTVEVASETGKGTTLTVLLPCGEPDLLPPGGTDLGTR